MFEWFGGRTDLIMPVVRRIWLDSMPQLLATWPGAQSKAERIREDEVVDTGMVRATCGPCSWGFKHLEAVNSQAIRCSEDMVEIE